MCELCLHGYLLYADKEFNLVPYVGDIHFRALTSDTLNQINWKKASNKFESNQNTKPLMMRGEHERSITMYNKHTIFLEIKRNRE